MAKKRTQPAKDRGINKKTGLPNKKSGPKSLIEHDPEAEIYAIEKLALGFAQWRVAKALGVDAKTITNWLNNPEFSKKVHTREMELADGPLNKVMQGLPLEWLKRKFRSDDEFGEPSKKTEVDAEIVIRFEGWQPKENG